MTAGRPPHGLFCPSGRSLLAAHSYPALTRGHTTTLPYLATLPRLSPGPAIRPSSSSCPSYPALTRGHTTTLPCLATLPRLSPDPTHPAVLTLPPIRPPAVPDLRHAPVCRPVFSAPLRPSSPRRPSGRPPFLPCGTTRSVALPAARPPDFTATPSPVRPPLHLPSLCPLPYNRSPVHGSAFLTPRTPRSAAPPPHRSAALENTSPGGFDRLLPAELSPSARKTADLAGKNSFFHAEAVSLQPQRQWYLPQTAARSGCADDTCINVEHTLHPGSRYGGS